MERHAAHSCMHLMERTVAQCRYPVHSGRPCTRHFARAACKVCKRTLRPERAVKNQPGPVPAEAVSCPVQSGSRRNVLLSALLLQLAGQQQAEAKLVIPNGPTSNNLNEAIRVTAAFTQAQQPLFCTSQIQLSLVILESIWFQRLWLHAYNLQDERPA